MSENEKLALKESRYPLIRIRQAVVAVMRARRLEGKDSTDTSDSTRRLNSFLGSRELIRTPILSLLS